MTQEQGNPSKASRGEIQYGADFLLWYAEEAKRIYGETIPAPRPDQRFIVLRQPVGVVGGHYALELSHVHDNPQSGSGSGCGLHGCVKTGGSYPSVRCRNFQTF